MIPLEKLDQVTTADGRKLSLHRRAGDYLILVDGRDLMTSRSHGSEQQLAELGWRELSRSPASPRVLVGGLGMGYTVRAALDLLPATASLVVAEVFAEVVRWNERWLGELCGWPLRDGRVAVEARDVAELLRPDPGFDLILLDVDNGPDALTLASNRRLYGQSGLARASRALRAGGALAVWSAAPDQRFVKRMRAAGLRTRSETVRARGGNKGPRHTIFIGRRS